MKNKILLALATIATLVAMPAMAQLDFYAEPRTVQIIPTASMVFTNLGATTQTYWTNWIDAHNYAGIAKIDFSCTSNSVLGGGAVGFTNAVYSSPDKTNLTLISTASLATSTSVVYTNLMYGGTNLLATNIFLLPGTSSTVVPATAGYAPPNSLLALLTQNPFTNNATINCTAGGVFEIGFNVQDTARYIAVVTSEGGAGTNSVFTANAILTGRKQY